MVIYYIAVVLLLIGGMLFLRKVVLKNANKLGGVKSGACMKILDRLVVAQDKQILLVEIGNKMLLVGVSSQRVETMAEYRKEEFDGIFDFDDTGGNNTDGGGFGNNFLSILSKKLNIKDNGKNVNEK